MKIVSIILGIALAAVIAPAYAEILSDSQLDGISAGLSLSVNDQQSNYAASSQQSNIGLLVAGGPVSLVTASNANTAYISGTDNGSGLGSSSGAFQDNIGAIVSLDGSISQSSMVNSNYTEVGNTTTGTGTSNLNGTSLRLDASPYGSLDVNRVNSSNSAFAAQNNINALVALGIGGLGTTSSIAQNYAMIVNTDGSAAVAVQNNVNVAVADEAIGTVTLALNNDATVDNEYINNGSVQASNLTGNVLGMGLMVNSIIADKSSAACQSNISGMVALSGYVAQSGMTNVNTANVSNTSGI